MDENVYLIRTNEVESAERMARADFMIRVRKWSNNTLDLDSDAADKWWPTTKQYSKMYEKVNKEL